MILPIHAVLFCLLPCFAFAIEAPVLPVQSNISVGSNPDPPENWYISIARAPPPYRAFRQKDVYLGGIAALSSLAELDWNAPVQTTTYFEPTFPSPLRVYIKNITGIVTPVANAVWSVWDTLLYYSGHPDFGFVEMAFSTYVDDIRVLKGGWFYTQRPTPVPASSLPGAVNLSSVGSGLASSQGGVSVAKRVMPEAASPDSLLVPLNVSTLRTASNITVPDTTTNNGELILSFEFNGDAPRLTPKSVYLALAGLIKTIAPRPKTNRVVTEEATDPDEITRVRLVRHATDSRGRGLFVYGQAFGLPRSISAVLTNDAIFQTGHVDVFNVGGDVLLGTLSVEKGPRWQVQTIEDPDDMVDIA